MTDKSIHLDRYGPLSIAKEIAVRVREKRLELNLTQQALATRSGVSLGSLKRFENRYEISLRHLLLLAIALQATEEFTALFSHTLYQSVDDVVNRKQKSKRQRGRENG